VQPDPRHHKVRVRSRILSSYCAQQGLPTTPSVITIPWLRALNKFFHEEYNTGPFISLRPAVFFWCKKFSFTDTEDCRWTFKRSEIVQSLLNGEPSIMRIDNILALQFRGVKHLFIHGTELVPGNDDPVLGPDYPHLAPIPSSSGEPLIIGLSSLLPVHLYAIPVEADRTSSGNYLKLADAATAIDFIQVIKTPKWM